MFIVGIFMLVFGSIFSFSMLSTLDKVTSYPRRYRLQNGLDEETLTVLAVIAIIVALTGIVLLIFGWIKRKNKNMLDSIENQGKQNICPNCNVAVESSNGTCPICGRQLRGD